LQWAGEIGTGTHALVKQLLAGKPHPEQGYRSCLGLMALARRYGADRLEAACSRAQAIGSPRLQSVDSILKQGLDLLPLAEDEGPQALPEHENIRGPAYYADPLTTD
jgi:transposase